MGEATFELLVASLTSKSAREIVEYGSGLSSVRLALALPNARITSVEADRSYVDRVRELGRAHGVDPLVLHRPLEFRQIAGHRVLSYAPTTWDRELDAVIIDGPQMFTLRGREACLYEAYDRLRVGGLVFLDDCFRVREQVCLQTWPAVFQDSFTIRVERGWHGIAILEKIAHVNAASLPPQSDWIEVERLYVEIAELLTLLGPLPMAKWWPLDYMREVFGVSGPATARNPSAIRDAFTRLSALLSKLQDPGI